MIAIEDYAAIGDGRTVALVGRHGAIDWLCWPRFDSASIFGAMLDEHGGSWRLAAAAPGRVTRRPQRGFPRRGGVRHLQLLGGGVTASRFA